MLKMNGRILRVYPTVMAYDIKLEKGGETCYVDFLIEMRMRGYRLNDTVHLSDAHFWTVIKKM